MVKEAIDFSAMEDTIARPRSLDELVVIYGTDIAIKTQQMTKLVETIDKGQTTAEKVVSFADNQEPSDFFARYKGMTNVFNSFGLLEAYYEPDSYPKLATQTVDEFGWQLTLRRPDNKGRFHIVFISDSLPGLETNRPVGRQTVFYKRGV